MCGIAGFLYKQPAQTGPIGRILLEMLDVLGSRGTDGTGVALYGAAEPRGMILRLNLGAEGAEAEARLARVAARLEGFALLDSATIEHDYARLVVRSGGASEPASQRAWIDQLGREIEAADAGVAVFSVGRGLEIVKQVGVADALRERYGLAAFEGGHGIGHTRLATESKVDIGHCHPFWARPYADIAVVHNGQITNYRKLRRLMEMRGTHFATGNDSEIIALYIAERLQRGHTLEEALRSSLDDLDGTFTYLVSTAQGIGMAKDRFATKPLVVAETEEWVAIASEETALLTALPGQLTSSYQPAAGEISVWTR